MSNSQKEVKMFKRCQIVKMMANVKKSNNWIREEIHKSKLYTMRFTHNDAILMSHVKVIKTG